MISEPSFESSSHGRIEQIFLTIPSWVLRYQRQVEIRGTAAVYRDVFKTLDTNVRFLVVTHEEGESHLAEWSKELGVQDRTDVILLPNQTKLSVWAEDTFTICTDRSGHRWILQPVSEEHPSETVIAESIAESTGWGHVPTDHRFQGGNILVGDDFWFLGADSAEGSTLGSRGGRDAAAPGSGVCDGAVHRVMDESRERHLIFSRLPVPGFEDGLQVREIEVNGRPWLETCYRGNRKNTVQPMFHIDAFLTLAGRAEDGRYCVLVGDPALAVETIGVSLPEHAMQDAFDDIAVQLQQSGFSVVRNPLPLVYQDNHIAKVRHWYFASANNALVEIDGQEKTVWLPTYGHGDWSALEATDRLNKNIWRQLGFETRMVTNFHPFAMNLGALHCMAKCLVRGE